MMVKFSFLSFNIAYPGCQRLFFFIGGGKGTKHRERKNTSGRTNTEVVYNLPKNSGIFSWKVNGMTVLVRPSGNFPKKRNALKGSPKFPTEYPNGKLFTICDSHQFQSLTPILMCVTC